MTFKKNMLTGIATLFVLILFSTVSHATDIDNSYEFTYLQVPQEQVLFVPEDFPLQFKYYSGVDIDYPENGVKGIFVTGHSAGGSRLSQLIDLLNSTELNSMVIDVKDDYGNIVMPLESENKYIEKFTYRLVETEKLMTQLEDNDIYPIARIVVFKDTKLATERPDLSFLDENGKIWSNRNGESFVNPYQREVWEYNVEVARQAAMLGFKDIQFDYVRFPEGFEIRDEDLSYSRGEYEESDLDNIGQRVDAVTEFIQFAYQELQPFDVDISVDIFGYTVTLEEAPGIGQNFTRIAKNVDVISSMIYPSHWGPGTLGIDLPDLEPYNVVNNYIQMESEILAGQGEDAPVTRPWLQSFTASYLGSGNYINYGAHEVSEQIRALHDNGIEEYLLWNARNIYTEDAIYDFNN